MQESDIRIECRDGFRLAATLYPAAQADSPVLVIASALGVPRRFYASLAREMSTRGMRTLTFDYRGIGDSQNGPVTGWQMRMEDWGRLDIDAVLGHAADKLKAKRLFMIGHSCGGQLAGLAPNSERLDGLVFTAVSSAWPGHWPYPMRLGLQMMMYGLMPALVLFGGEYPARRFGISTMDAPSGVMSQWARWARKPGYLFDPAHGLGLERYKQLCLPLLSYNFDDDSYAPLPAAEAILKNYPAAQITRRRIKVADHGGKPIGHFGYFRERFRDTLWRDTADWLMSDIPVKVALHG